MQLFGKMGVEAIPIFFLYQSAFWMMILLSSLAYSQNFDANTERVWRRQVLPGQTPIFGKPLPASEIEIQTTLFKTWQKGEVVIKDDRVLEDLFLNIDIYRNNFYILKGGQAFLVMNDPIQSVNISGPKADRKFLTVKGLENEGEDYKIYEVIFDGSHVDLLTHYELIIKNPHYVEGYDMGRRDVKHEIKPVHYLRINSGETVELPKSRKKVKSVLSTYLSLDTEILQQLGQPKSSRASHLVDYFHTVDSLLENY